MMCPMTFAGLGAAVAATALAASQIPGVAETIDAGQRAEKLGIVGILAVCLIVCIFALIWIAHKISGKWEQLMERAITAANNASAAAAKLEGSTTELKQATMVLAEITVHCRELHRRDMGGH